jgi:hypothetical protein
MPFVDTTPANFSIKLTEDNFQEKFAELLTQYGWNGGKDGTSVVRSFHKVAHTKTAGLMSSDSFQFTIARHYIFKNASGKMFGMALATDVNSVRYGDLPSNDLTSTDYKNYIKDHFDKNKRRTTIYYYMLEKDPTNFTDGDVISVGCGSEFLRMALDVEVYGEDLYSTNPEADPFVMQSPIIQSTLRAGFYDTGTYPNMFTNWWPDSEIRLQGFIDENTIFAVIQTDNVPAWENNIVPTVPFYFGAIDPIDPGDDAVAMFAGTVPPGSTEDDVAEFKFSNPHSTVGTRIMPWLKTYPAHPSNGVDSVMVSRSKLGSRYQEYFLSWNTTSDAMIPDRKSETGLEYPRAWNNIYNDESKYQFNPSRYSGKVHTSKIYLVHPEEGVRGSLSYAIGLSALNFNAGKLRIRKQNCPDPVYDVYRFFMVGAVSPLTKRPATPYRPIGIGIYDSEYTP